MATATRPRLSRDFVQRHQRTRIIDATARCVVQLSYPATTVSQIVREAGIARNTFYDNFASKEDVAHTLVASEIGGPAIASYAMPLAIDLASCFRVEPRSVGGLKAASAGVSLSHKVQLDPLEVPGEDDPHAAKLPPGRHGLPPDFVVENQRRRLISGTARAVYEEGCAAATIADITRQAAVSRRTFYEYYCGKDDAVHAMVEEAEARCGLGLEDYDFYRGLDQLWAEIVASHFCGDEVGAEARRKAGLELVERCQALGAEGLAA